jgi:two-component system sensor histidine kinase PilS (NtrC family)
MLRDEKIPVRHKDKLMNIALNEMERLNNIITDFLTYSSPKPLDLQKTDLHPILDETLELIHNTADTKNSVKISRAFSGSLFVNADPQKMRQVFWNLGVNAVEAMPNGGELSVSTENSADKIKIVFTDTGAGIPEKDLEKIFYPFFTTKDKGTGLGLSIAYRIIEEHNGKLTAKSISGTKTTFEIILPK